jgi:hypothetical protein
VGYRYISRFFETFPDFFRKRGRFLAQKSRASKSLCCYPLFPLL